MKQGRKPTREQRSRISELGLDSMEWLVSKDTPDEFALVSSDGRYVRVDKKTGEAVTGNARVERRGKRVRNQNDE